MIITKFTHRDEENNIRCDLNLNSKINILCGPEECSIKSILKQIVDFFITPDEMSDMPYSNGEYTLSLKMPEFDDDEIHLSNTVRNGFINIDLLSLYTDKFIYTGFLYNQRAGYDQQEIITEDNKEEDSLPDLFKQVDDESKFEKKRSFYREITRYKDDDLYDIPQFRRRKLDDLESQGKKKYIVTKSTEKSRVSKKYYSGLTWLLYSNKTQHHDEIKKANYEFAKRSFAFFDLEFVSEDFFFDIRDIKVKDKNEQIIEFQDLNDSCKEILNYFFLLIAEIEDKSKQKYKVECFDGVILLDDCGSNLSPEWQLKLFSLISQLLRYSQIITVTFNPYMLKQDNSEGVIVLDKEDGCVMNKTSGDIQLDLSGWSSDEITFDLIKAELPNNSFDELLERFGSYIDENNYQNALQSYEKLIKAMHPNSYLRKLLKFQLLKIKQYDQVKQK